MFQNWPTNYIVRILWPFGHFRLSPFTVFYVFLLFNFLDIIFSPSHLFTLFTDLTRPFSSTLSLSSILTVHSRPLRIYSSFSSSQKKYPSFSSLFSLRSTEISREWKYLEKYNKKEQWKFLVIFPKRSTEISSLLTSLPNC